MTRSRRRRRVATSHRHAVARGTRRRRPRPPLPTNSSQRAEPCVIALWGHIVGSAIIRLLPRRVWYRVADLLLPLVLAGWPGQVRRASQNMRRVLGNGASEQEVRRRTGLA